MVKRLLQRHAHRPTAEHALQEPFILKNVPPPEDFPARQAPETSGFWPFPTRTRGPTWSESALKPESRSSCGSFL